MIADCFLDTNVLVYAVDSTPENGRKREISIGLLESLDFGVSAQVLLEFFVTVTRKLELPLVPGAAVQFIQRLSLLPVVATDADLVFEGILCSLENHISYWDGAIIAAAQRLEAATLYSEDLNHGQVYGTVRVVNPYL